MFSSVWKTLEAFGIVVVGAEQRTCVVCVCVIGERKWIEHWGLIMSSPSNHFFSHLHFLPSSSWELQKKLLVQSKSVAQIQR